MAALAALAPLQTQAAEGMWMPQQLPQISKALSAAGLQIEPSRLSKLTEFPMGAVVSLGGCTASFVSPLGLIVTNHHCAYGSIQYNSSAQRDLLQQGFLAASLSDELPAAPGSRVLVTVAVSDVSGQVLDAKTQALAGKARYDAIEAGQKRLTAACEADAGHRCHVASFYGGLQYQLIKQMELRDIRLVHAPALGVGLFGGDADNWMWPRHTGDYSFYRAYVGPDGRPADFHPNNKPFVPKHHLTLASQSLKEGDFLMVAGYPGDTNRHRLPAEVDFTFSWQQPSQIQLMGEQLALIKTATHGRRDAEIAVADRVAGIANYHKNMQGQQASFEGSDILARKTQSFAELKAWVAADGARQVQYGADIARVENLLAQSQEIARAEQLLDYTSPRLLAAARSLYKYAQQQALPDAQRLPGYQARDSLRFAQGMETLQRRYDEPVDKSLSAHFLARYLALPAAHLNQPLLAALGLQAGMTEAAIATRLDALYAASQLNQQAERMAWLQRDVAAFKASQDGFIKAAVALYADDQAREARDKALSGQLDQAYANTMKALIAFKASKGEAVYPDANGTLRVAFGHVKGRKGAVDGADWQAFTTLRGISAKHTGEGEFNAPAQQLAAIKARQFDRYKVDGLDSVPVNFLATLDTTGGNSGSPVLNDRAELVGLLFDGTLDSVIDSWDFDPQRSRSICLDARYMLWQMKVVDKADRLLREMQVL
ncbi:MAG: S46 family peptidase [Paucibacter sp.]|nr:S46 family peptidase [Roseateles sp.]